MKNCAYLDSVVFDIIGKSLKDSAFDAVFDGYDAAADSPRESFFKAICGNEEVREAVRDYMLRTEGNSYLRSIVIPTLSAFNAAPPKEIVDALVYIAAAELCDDLNVYKYIDDEKNLGVVKFIADFVRERYLIRNDEVYDLNILKRVHYAIVLNFGPGRYHYSKQSAIPMRILKDFLDIKCQEIFEVLEEYELPDSFVAISGCA